MYGALSSLGAGLPERYTYPITIACYGDSTTEGWQSFSGVSSITKNNVPSLLQTYCRQEFSRTAFVINKGVGGTQASQILNGEDGRNKSWSEEMLQTTATIITLNFCLNDAYYHEVPTPGYEQETPVRYREIIREMVTVAKGEGKEIILLEPNPVTTSPRKEVLQLYVDALNDAAAMENVRIVHHFSAILAQSDWETALSDGVHPKDEMYIDKSRREFSVLANVIAPTL